MSPELDKLIQDILTGLCYGAAIGSVLALAFCVWLWRRFR